MTRIESVAVPPQISLAASPPGLSCNATDHHRTSRCAWLDRLDGYVAAPQQAGGQSGSASPGSVSKGKIDWGEIFAILGGKNPRVGITPYRSPRSVDNMGLAGTGAREPIVGAALASDFGIELIRVFRGSELNTWQRADAIARVLQEWVDDGPSLQAGKRLQRLFDPAYIHTPDEPAGSIVVDAIMLHLLDRGRYSALVRDHIDSLKRSGDYASLVQALHRRYPDKDTAWAENTVDKLLASWDPASANTAGDDGGNFIPPGIDLDTRLRKFHQLMNPDYRPGQGDRPIIRRHDAADGDTVPAPAAGRDGPIRYA